MVTTRILPFLVTVLSLALLLEGSSPARANNFDPWTTVGSAGTVDEADTSIVAFSSGSVSVAGAAPLPATLDLRYNVVAVDGLLQNSDAVNLQVRFRDNGANARVIVRLRQYNLNTGVITTPLTLDSNAFPAAASSQVQSVNSTCFAGNFFDFNNNAYFLEAQLIKSAAGGDPVLAIIRIGTLVC